MHKITALFAALPILAACGGGGGDTLGLPDGPPAYRALAQDALTIADQIETHTTLASVPTSGSPTFEGVMLIAEDADAATIGYTGAVSLTANFTGGGNGTVSGSATGFYRGAFDAEGNSIGSGTPVGGTIDLNSASVSTGLFDMAVSGSLDVDGATTGAATGTLDAAFTSATGANPDAIVGLGDNLQFGGAAGSFDAFLLAN